MLNSPSHDVVYHTMSLKKRCKITAYFRLDKKKATHELRKNNGVPCVLYGVQKDENGLPVATHFSVPTEGLRNLVYTPHIYVVDLNIDGKIVNAILKDIQFHPVTDAILHVDFYQIDVRCVYQVTESFGGHGEVSSYGQAVFVFLHSIQYTRNTIVLTQFVSCRLEH